MLLRILSECHNPTWLIVRLSQSCAALHTREAKMVSSLQFSPNTRLSIRYSTQLLVNSLRPFIKSVHSHLEGGRAFRDSILAACDNFPEISRYFCIDPSSIEESFALRDEYLFQEWALHSLLVLGGSRPLNIKLGQMTGEQIVELHRFIANVSRGSRNEINAFASLSEPLLSVFRVFLDNQNLVETLAVPSPVATVHTPGIYRLQHASLLYRTVNTGILVDPHLHSTFDPGLQSTISRPDLNGKVDAILISHFHEDHWSLSTLMMFDPSTPIVVPKVPCSSVICDSMEHRLRSVGFKNIFAVDWYSQPIIIGDLEVFVLPFFGEQPLRYEPSRHPHLRNWGNTYLIRSKYYTSWFLIDSGSDAAGSMTEVAEHVKQRFGKIDVLLSNLRKFFIFDPSYINGGLNWLTLSAAQMARFPSMKDDCITLGAENVAHICKLVDAQYYLPYAHWWGELGDVGNSGLDLPGQEEIDLLQELRQCINAISCTTKIVPWKIGDGFAPQTAAAMRGYTSFY
jgi:hypothetical protein